MHHAAQTGNQFDTRNRCLPKQVADAVLPRLAHFVAIKCNGQRPVCSNCATYGEQCFFEPVSEPAKEAGRARHVREKGQRPRQKPTARRRAERQATTHAEEQTGEGEQARASIEAAETSSHGEDGDDAGSVEGTAMRAQPSPDSRVSRIVTTANGISSYHGRTSALFEDSIPERQPAGDVQPRMPDDWIERGLVAEAARQSEFLRSADVETGVFIDMA
ncbi:hypothetical protein CRV24_002000 [Beauveria bassiana]|nr:hypothetical protein CRV24_002000 [Beauveria bassiana]